MLGTRGARVLPDQQRQGRLPREGDSERAGGSSARSWLRSALSDPFNYAMVALVLLASMAAAYHWLGSGADEQNYRFFYSALPRALYVEDFRFESGFVYLAWACKFIAGFSYESFVLAISIISLSTKAYLFRKYLRSPIFAIMTYLMFFYPLHEYNQIRTALATSVVYAALHFAMQNRYAISGWLVIIGCTIHSSVILVFVVYVGYIYIRNVNRAIVLLAIFALVFLFGVPVIDYAVGVFSSFSPIAASYVDNAATYQVPTVLSVQNVSIVAALLLSLREVMRSPYEYQRAFAVLVFSSFVFLVLFISAPVIAQRGKEILSIAILFVVFRYKVGPRRAFPAFMLFAGGAWTVYRVYVDGVVGA
jgi:hypothetical protein